MLPECRNEGGLLFNPGNFTVIFRTVLREKSRQKIFSGIWPVSSVIRKESRRNRALCAENADRCGAEGRQTDRRKFIGEGPLRRWAPRTE